MTCMFRIKNLWMLPENCFPSFHTEHCCCEERVHQDIIWSGPVARGLRKERRKLFAFCFVANFMIFFTYKINDFVFYPTALQFEISNSNFQSLQVTMILSANGWTFHSFICHLVWNRHGDPALGQDLIFWPYKLELEWKIFRILIFFVCETQLRLFGVAKNNLLFNRVKYYNNFIFFLDFN